MNLSDLKDQLLERLSTLWSQIQDSSAYINLKERYENLPSNGQRLVIIGAAIFAVFVILYTPWSYLSSSSDSMQDFVNTRELTRELFKVARSGGAQPLESVTADSIQDRVQTELKNAGLLQNQIVSVTKMNANQMKEIAFGGALVHEEGLEIKVKKLNIKQIVDIGYRLERISPVAKLLSLTVTADTTNKHYFDVTMGLATFSVPISLPHPNFRHKGV